MLAHYYHGRVLFNADSLAESSVAFLEAEQYALKQNDNLYLGMIYAWMSSVYNSAYNHKEELKCAQKSLEYFKKHADEKYIGNATFALAQSYNNTKQFDEAKSMYEDIIHSAKDSMLRYYAIHDYAHTLYLTKEYKLTKKWIITLLKSKPELMSATKYSELAMAYLYEDKQDSAMYYLSLGEKVINTTLDSATIAQCRYSIAIKNKDYESALKARLHVNKIQDNTTIKVWQQAVVKTQRDYLYQTNKAIIAEKKLQQIYIIIVSGVIISLIVGLLIYVQNKRKKDNAKYVKLQKVLEWQNLNSKEQLDKNKQAILYLEKQLMQSADKNNNLKIELKQKTVELAEANKLIQQQLQLKELAETNIRSSEIYKMISDFILQGKAVTGLDHWNKIFNLIDSFYPHFRDTLYSLCKISDIEIKVCVLIKIGFTPTEIAILTSSSKSNISSIRSRLYAKIFKKQGSAKDFDDFLDKL